MTKAIRNSNRRNCGEELEPKYCLADVAFIAHDIVRGGAAGARSVYAADVDTDGDLDVLSASYRDDTIAWYENTDAKGTFGIQRVITTQAVFAKSVRAADLDGDGDVDALSASNGGVAWYENTDGKGTFGSQRAITTGLAWSVDAADVDGDGDLDVIEGSFTTNRIGEPTSVFSWQENVDGKGTFVFRRVLGTRYLAYPTSVYTTDVDGDGDADVLVAFSNNFSIVWFENRDGKGLFGDPRIIQADQLISVGSATASDIDGDGDVDVFAAFYGGGLSFIAWYENRDGKGNFGDQRVITTEVASARSVHVADVDGDGDIDVLSASFDDDKIAWYENTDGKGAFGSPLVINRTANGASSVYAMDLDRDGDVDVLSASFEDATIAWYENLTRRSLVGDSNDDGVFNSSDLVFVFQAGKYEDGIPKNATFEEGDWNGDGDFDSADLVLAFQEGHYVAAARPVADRFATAIDWLFALDDEWREHRQDFGLGQMEPIVLFI